MVANPMQRKARNSFLIGMISTLLVCVIIGGLLFFFLTNKDKKEEEERGLEQIAYVLNQDVKSGQIITPSMFSQITVYANMIPSNYISNQVVSELTTQTVDGSILYSAQEGNGETVYYIEIDAQRGSQYKTVGNQSNGKVKVKIEQDAGGYYRTTNANQKEYIQFLDVPVIAKVDLKANTILTSSVVSKSNQVTTDDVRYVEYNMLQLSTTLAEGDYIDIRLTLPNGQDLIVVSKKEIKSLIGNTLGLELTEDEILMMESSIVEAYIMTASKLYAVQYVEPGMQGAAVKTYTPTDAVQNLIIANGNIKEEARNALASRFDPNMRGYINREMGAYEESRQTNLETGIQKEIEDAKAAREEYLSSLNASESATTE